MKKVIFVLVLWMAFVAFIVAKTVSKNATNSQVEEALFQKKILSCGDKGSRSEVLRESQNPALRKLGELEAKCASSATNTLMYFTIMPKDSLTAKKLAEDTATVIKEYNQDDLKPLIVVEPTSDWGLVDFKEFETGFWDPWINAYFKDLKNLGIKDDMVEAWVPFPEANLPYWNHQNTAPSDFAMVVNRYLGIMKKYFPNAHGSILLNSATYATDDYNWADGEYLSLKPYVVGIKKEYVDSFGLQGLPWMPAANAKGNPIFEPAEFLNHKLAQKAADAIGVKKIWFNTGTFAAKYTSEPEKKDLIPASIRKEMLDKILNEADILEKAGYQVSVNLFSQDKSNEAEATDWAYWGSEYTANEGHMTALLQFLKDAKNKNVDVWLFLR